MKKLMLCLTLVGLIMSCTSDENDTQTKPLTTHFGLTFSGAGFSNESININRRQIAINNDRVYVTAGDDNLVNFFGFYLPFPIEKTTYTMVEGSSANKNTVFFSRNQKDVYYTTNGTITITEIVDGNNGCQTYKGTMNVNLAFTSDTNQILNVSGSFEIPTEECD